MLSGRLPEHLDFFCHFQKIIKRKLPIELGAFALKVSSHAFDVRDSINLLYARRYVMKSLETILGPCRDYNGGLFEKQQEHFEKLRVCLSDKIPLFDLFAEKVFYALHPVEKRLLLSLEDAEVIFTAFSDAVQRKNISHQSYSEKVTIIKSANTTELPRLSHLNQEFKKHHIYARVHLGGFHYHCVLRDCARILPAFEPHQSPAVERLKVTPCYNIGSFAKVQTQELLHGSNVASILALFS